MRDRLRIFGAIYPQFVTDSLEIVSLVDGDFKTWNEGENPFTGGAELVPVVENAKDNWNLLTQEYT